MSSVIVNLLYVVGGMILVCTVFAVCFAYTFSAAYAFGERIRRWRSGTEERVPCKCKAFWLEPSVTAFVRYTQGRHSIIHERERCFPSRERV